MLIKGLQPGDCRRSYIEERVLIHSALFFCMKMASLSQLLHFCHREIFRYIISYLLRILFSFFIPEFSYRKKPLSPKRSLYC